MVLLHVVLLPQYVLFFLNLLYDRIQVIYILYLTEKYFADFPLF